MHLTRAQIVGLNSLAMNSPVEAKFDIGKPDSNGIVFVKVQPGSFPVPEGQEPLYRLNPGGGWEAVREAPKVGSESLDLDAA